MVRTYTIDDAPRTVRKSAKRRLNRYFDAHDIEEFAPMKDARDTRMFYFKATTPQGSVRLYVKPSGEIQEMLQSGDELVGYLEGFGYDSDYEPAN